MKGSMLSSTIVRYPVILIFRVGAAWIIAAAAGGVAAMPAPRPAAAIPER
jgi:hypothetical protein